MKKIQNIFYLFLILTTKNGLSRSPSIDNAIENLSEKICFYENNLGKTDFDLMKFIPLFENIYNSNALQDKKLKGKIFCILLNFYREEDPGFAEVFERQNSLFDCTQSFKIENH